MQKNSGNKWRLKNLNFTALSGQANLSGNIIKSIELPFPSSEEQTRIAQILSDMDAEIEMLEQKLEKYKKIKQGMMQNLLTGNVRLV